MPTASISMVETLTKDMAPLEKKISKLQDFAKEYDQSELCEKIGALAEPLGKIKPRVDKWAREIALKPPIYPDEAAYKMIRAALTKLVSVTEQVDKKATEEKKVFDSAVKIKVVGAAKAEILGKDKSLAQALAAVARGDKGRSSPKTDDLPALNHIHIGGQAKDNLIFDPAKKLVLGRIAFHMDSTMNKAQKDKVKKVCERSGSVFTVQVLNKEEIAEVK